MIIRKCENRDACDMVQFNTFVKQLHAVQAAHSHRLIAQHASTAPILVEIVYTIYKSDKTMVC